MSRETPQPSTAHSSNSTAKGVAELPILPLAEAKALSDGLRLYGWMTLSRALDEALCAANPRWFPSAGEEATMVGAFCDLRPDDAIAAHYRDPLVIYMMRGAETVSYTHLTLPTNREV